MLTTLCKRADRLSAVIGTILPRAHDGASMRCAGIATLGLAFGACGIANATVYVVSGNGDPGTGGTSLRQTLALADAGPGNIVVFDSALNGSTITLTQGQIAINNSTQLVGPGAKKLTISGGGVSRIFRLNGNASQTISGLTLTAGNSPGGAAIYAYGPSLTLQDCVITGNTNTSSLGASVELIQNGTNQISGSTISGNVGTGISADFNELSIDNTTISGNTTGSNGAGIRANRAKLTITQSTISGNTAAQDGGGIFITDNAMYGAKAALTLTDSNVSGNFAYNYGAGIDIKSAKSVYINRSLISGNSLTDFSGSGYGGGGVALQSVSATAQIFNTTIYRNFAYHNGGGIGIFDAATGSNTEILFSTITGNSTAYFYSNGIQGAGNPHIYSTIIANNTSKFFTQDMAGTFLIDHSLLKNATGVTFSVGSNFNFFGTDPQLGPLADNGGPTRTMLPAVTSAVLDEGNPGCCAGLTTDQRGLPRIVNGTPDMGAVERQYPEDIIFRDGFNSS